MPRKCGGCTACCFTHPVLSIDKDGMTACSSCTASGCAVYERRPKDCADFVCQWLKDFGAEDERPDKTGIVIDYHVPDVLSRRRIKVGSLWEAVPGALSRDYAREKAAKLLKAGIPTMAIYATGRQVLFLPQGVVLLAEESQALMTLGVELHHRSTTKAVRQL